MCKSDKFFVIYKVVRYLNEFWNLFLDKVYLKDERFLSKKNVRHLISFRKCQKKLDTFSSKKFTARS